MDESDVKIIVNNVITHPSFKIEKKPIFSIKGQFKMDENGFPIVEQMSTKPVIEEITDLLKRDPVVFLERYGNLLTTKDLESFIIFSDPAVRWHREKLFKKLQPIIISEMSDKTEDELRSEHEQLLKKNQIKNRRFAYMNQYLRGSSYFSKDSIKERHPLIFEQFYGKETVQPFDEREKLSERLYKNMEIDIISERKKIQMRKEGIKVETEEESSSEYDSNDDEDIDADEGSIEEDPFRGISSAHLASLTEVQRQDIIDSHTRILRNA